MSWILQYQHYLRHVIGLYNFAIMTSQAATPEATGKPAHLWVKKESTGDGSELIPFVFGLNGGKVGRSRGLQARGMFDAFTDWLTDGQPNRLQFGTTGPGCV